MPIVGRVAVGPPMRGSQPEFNDPREDREPRQARRSSGDIGADQHGMVNRNPGVGLPQRQEQCAVPAGTFIGRPLPGFWKRRSAASRLRWFGPTGAPKTAMRCHVPPTSTSTREGQPLPRLATRATEFPASSQIRSTTFSRPGTLLTFPCQSNRRHDHRPKPARAVEQDRSAEVRHPLRLQGRLDGPSRC